MEFTEIYDSDYIKTCAAIARHSYIEDMENKLSYFEKRLQSKNFKVYWASTESDLVEMVKEILPSKTRNKVCFDLDTIPQGFKDSRFIPIPIAQLENGSQTANVLFTQADFGVVDTGTLVFINRKSKNCFQHVERIYILLDISKLVNKTADLEVILYLRSLCQNQKFLPQEVKLINAPHVILSERITPNGDKITATEVEMIVFLYDNGVTNILQDSELRSALYCIDCGRCKTVCPVYKYDKEFTPIHLVRANCFEHHRQTGDLEKRALLCGNCEQVCPVQIPFTNLIIKELALSKLPKKGILSMVNTFKKRKKLNKMSGSFYHRYFVRKIYGKNRMLFNYFKDQKEPFYNILHSQQIKDDEQ